MDTLSTFTLILAIILTFSSTFIQAFLNRPLWENRLMSHITVIILWLHVILESITT